LRKVAVEEKKKPNGHDIAKASFTEVVVVVVCFLSLASYLTTGV